jgi:NosR/NirI family transcriptional regulator, nitrous oxide reductase regulator
LKNCFAISQTLQKVKKEFMEEAVAKTNQIAQPGQKKSRPVTQWIFLGSTLLAVLAWVIGYFSTGTNVLPMVPDVLPGAARVEARGSLYVAYNASGEIAGYAALGSGQGYGGPIQMLVGVDPAGNVTGAKIVSQRETPGFFRLILQNNLIGKFIGQNDTAPLAIGQDIDAVSGATLSSEGVAASIRQSVRQIAQDGLKTPLPPESQSFKFGIPEISLIGLYAAGYFGHKLKSAAWKRRIRWGTLLTGMVVLGFIYTAPFTISQVIALISGYWPDWHNNLYWYLLIGGILFVTTVESKNPYCSWFCPFGAVQECLAQITKAKTYRPRRWSQFFTWLQRGLAFTAVILGLISRQPGAAGYEPFATLFDLSGTLPQVIFLGVILFASLVIYRPFCNYLCPLDPVYDFIREGRRITRETWKLWQKKLLKP